MTDIGDTQPTGDVFAAMRRQQEAERQHLVGALQALSQTPERSPFELGSNLLADALYQYALDQHDAAGPPGEIEASQPGEQAPPGGG